MTEQNGETDQSGRARILLLLDASQASLAALEAAVDLAASRQMELHGVFVEEVQLLRSAGFAFAHEIGAHSGASRPLDQTRTEADLRRVAERARSALARAASSRGVRHHLNVRRGDVVSEVLALASPEDLLVLGRVGRAGALGRSLGSSARMLVREAPGPVLIWSAASRRRQDNIVVVVEGADACRPPLTTAVEMARARRCALSVVLVTLEDAQANRERDHVVNELLATAGVDVHMHRLPPLAPRGLARALTTIQGDALILSRRGSLVSSSMAESILETMQVPITVTP